MTRQANEKFIVLDNTVVDKRLAKKVFENGIHLVLLPLFFLVFVNLNGGGFGPSGMTPQPPLLGYTDEQVHTFVAGQIAYNLSKVTGSQLLGERAARSAGYAKETFDVFTGNGWSEQDLRANEEGIWGIF